jgi:hypothetical protein
VKEGGGSEMIENFFDISLLREKFTAYAKRGENGVNPRLSA